MSKLNYGNIPIPLDVAGRQFFPGNSDFITFQNAIRSSDGSQDLDAKIRVRFGTEGSDYARWGLGDYADGMSDGFEVEWDAQPGVVAYVFWARGPNVLRSYSKPARQLVTSAVGTTLGADPVAIVGGDPAVVISAANANRQSVCIQPLTGDLYIGPAGVDASTGFKIAAGDAYTVDKTTAAIYGFSAGNNDVRKLEEFS